MLTEARRLPSRPPSDPPDAPLDLGALYAQYARPLLALAYRLLGDAADAEDVLHDVFLGLPEALRRYEERGSLESWLKRLTARVALNRLRTRTRRRETAIDDVDTPRARTSAVHDALDLATAIAALPEAQRTVFVLREVEGFTHAEIAALLDITPNASEVRLHRAIRALRRTLRPDR